MTLTKTELNKEFRRLQNCHAEISTLLTQAQVAPVDSLDRMLKLKTVAYLSRHYEKVSDAHFEHYKEIQNRRRTQSQVNRMYVGR